MAITVFLYHHQIVPIVNIVAATSFLSKRAVSLVVCSEKWVRHSKFNKSGNRFWITALVGCERANWKKMQCFLPVFYSFLTVINVHTLIFCISLFSAYQWSLKWTLCTVYPDRGLRPSVNTLTVPKRVCHCLKLPYINTTVPIFFHFQWFLLQHTTLPFEAV